MAAEALPSHLWWSKVPTDRQRSVREVVRELRYTIGHPMFDRVGTLQQLPFGSRVLLRRNGYREMLNLWRIFRNARRPLFSLAETAIEVRDIATLYETWAFLVLIEEIAVQTRTSPSIDLRVLDDDGLVWGAKARFGDIGVLAYNEYQRSYSVPLRPDFTWIENGVPQVVLDAKFRLERGDIEGIGDQGNQSSVAKSVDLYKMHTYRDALGVRAAVSVYPGDNSVFYDCQIGRLNGVALKDVLRGDLCGIGALAFVPGGVKREE
jgi:predicted component of viral defense system (DUF524 family)